MSKARAIALFAAVLVLGSIRSVPAAVDASGQFTMSIRVATPSFHDLEPSIELAYSSQAANGFLGVGWTLSMGPTIARISASRGTPQLEAADVFLLDGQALIPCTATSTSPSCTTAVAAFGSSANFFFTEAERYERIRRDPGGLSFTVWRKDGTRLLFAAQLYGRRFLLASVEDLHGNRVTYTTWCDGTLECYPDKITYAGAGPSAPGAEIRFYRESRPDRHKIGTGGAVGELRYRLRTIGVSMNGGLVRAYALAYSKSAATEASILTSVTTYASDAAVAADGTVKAGPSGALPPVTLQTPSTQAGAAAGGWAFSSATSTQGLPSLPEPRPGNRDYSVHHNGLKVENPALLFYDTPTDLDKRAPYGERLVTGTATGARIGSRGALATTHLFAKSSRFALFSPARWDTIPPRARH